MGTHLLQLHSGARAARPRHLPVALVHALLGMQFHEALSGGRGCLCQCQCQWQWQWQCQY